MKIITENDTPLPPDQKTIVTVGNFDGVHLGHARLIARAVGLARESGAAAAAVAFEPHTRAVVYPELSTMLLTTIPERAALMAEMGVDYLFLARFDEKFREMGQAEFIEKVLAGRLRAAAWVMGEGQHVGRDREGGKKNLHFVCGKYHINTFSEPPEMHDGAMISSTRIRGLVGEGRLPEAREMLGRPYLIAARRVRGQQVATKRLDCPTLNFKMPEAGKVLPPPGVYAAELEVGACINADSIDTGKKRLFGALYFGDCPTYEGRETHFEFHALNFDRSGVAEPAVGESVNLWLYEYLRPGVAFPSEDALKAQIATDVDKIRSIFADNRY
ncbi:riboflavin biosynthesis protein RibF [Fibrobacteres bacterium R8-0-B4]